MERLIGIGTCRLAGTRRRQRGIALVAVLWILMLLSLLAANFARTTRTGTQLARNLVSNAQARALADAGIYRAIAGLMERAPERRPATDGTLYRLALGHGEVLLRLQDEGGKIDLNRAPGSMLDGLFRAAGVAPETSQALAEAVLDYRDRDHERLPGGAEDADYRAAGLPWGAKDAPFEAIEELRQVIGMNETLYRQVQPAITVYGRGRRINRATAPPLVLLALPGADQAAVAQRIEARAQQDEESLPIDAADAEGADADNPTAARRRLPRRSSAAVTVTAEAHTASGAVFVRQAVVRAAPRRTRRGRGQPYQILAWREGMPAAPATPAADQK